MFDPSTAQEWLEVARERVGDANSMLPGRANSVGPSYVAGYAVEAALKAYLQARGIPRPAGGRPGHDLRALWKATGLKLRDLKDTDGCAAFFVNEWTTALRYQVTRPPGHQESIRLVETAGRLVGNLSGRIRRKS